MNAPQARPAAEPARRPGADLPYRLAADPYWRSRESARVTAAVAIPGGGKHRGSRSPVNESVYELAARHDASLADFIREHDKEGAQVPTGRTALARRAREVAEASPEAGEDYAVRQEEAAIRATLVQGDDSYLATLRCPKCQCPGLIGARDALGRWRAGCDNGMCAYDRDPSDNGPDADPPTLDKIRTWSTWAVARNEIRRRRRQLAA